MPELWVDQPPDLYSQVLALGHIFTRKLCPEDQEEFKQELLLEIFSRWTEFDPRKAKMSVWITWIARGLCTDFQRDYFKQNCRTLHFEEHDNSENPHTRRGDDWLRTKAPRLFDDPDEPGIDLDESIEYTKNMIGFSNEELTVLEMRIDKCTTPEIALKLNGFTDDQIDELGRQSKRVTKAGKGERPFPPLASEIPLEYILQARKLIAQVKLKLRSVRAATNTQTQEPVETMVRIHAARKTPFNNASSFEIATPTYGTKSLQGIEGIQQAIELNHGASFLHERLRFTVDIPEQQRGIAKDFWQKYGKLIKRCSNIALDNVDSPNQFVGKLPDKEAVADVLMGITVAASVNQTDRIRQSATFKPTQSDFALLVWNLKNQGLLEGPAFDGAIESWRERLLHGRKSYSPRIPKQATV